MGWEQIEVGRGGSGPPGWAGGTLRGAGARGGGGAQPGVSLRRWLH